MLYEVITISGEVKEPEPWTPEFPVLYLAEFRLLDGAGQLIHTRSERIGFRTVEVREQDGIYVNGVRIKFKGVNRHSFHPDFGRTSCKSLSIDVITSYSIHYTKLYEDGLQGAADLLRNDP